MQKCVEAQSMLSFHRLQKLVWTDFKLMCEVRHLNQSRLLILMCYILISAAQLITEISNKTGEI